MKTGVFKSIEGRDKIREQYDRILSFFPYKQRYVETSFAKTFVLQAGGDNDCAVILLHGSCGNCAAWLGDIPALAGKYNVYALDIPGEAGNSEENRLDINSDEYPRWLGELMDGLGLKQAVVIGNSMGGWLALHFAALYPERLSALVLLAPSGIVQPKQTFLDQTAGITDNAESALPVRDSIIGADAIPREALDFLKLVLENFNPITETLPVLPDDKLSKLEMPVLMIAGTNDVIMDSGAAAERLMRYVPHARNKLIENAPHLITGEMAEVMRFLSEEVKPMDILSICDKNVAVIGRSNKIGSAQEALDLISYAWYKGKSSTIVVYKESLNEDFFDLKTGFAGEVLQKFSNYRMRLVVVGDFGQYKSKALHDFIYECNNGNFVIFKNSLDEAQDALKSIL